MVEKTSRSGMLERFVPVLIFISFLMAGFVGYLFNEVKNLKQNSVPAVTEQQAAAPVAKVELSQIKDLFQKDLIKFGDDSRKVLFVEVSDPSCPFCHVAGGLNPELNKQMGTQFILTSDGGSYVAPIIEMRKLVEEGKASFVWIYTNGHGNGEMGSKALYCANEKGKFWEAHDLLMSSKGYDLLNDVVKNDKAQSGKLADFLKSAVNADDMKSCLESGKYDSRLSSDMTLAGSLGVSGTPGFFVNENAFAGAYSYTDMQSLVESALK